MANREAKRKAEVRLLQLCVFLFSMTTTLAFYLVGDYYMDPGTSNGMGGVCNKRVQDACFYVNSHIDVWGLFDYDSNVDCTMTMDAGSMSGARYKLSWQWFWLEYGDCSKDYLAIYDADMNDMTNNTLIGKFCGGVVDITGYPTNRYLTFHFHTDGSTQKDGFRAKAVRYEPLPCQDNEFQCVSESICIDSRLKCDGTVQCDDATDENDCSFLEELLGGFFALGLGGMITTGVSTLLGCIGCWVIIGSFTCCKKCCTLCCTKCCFGWPCCKGRCGDPPTFNRCCTKCCCFWPCCKGECGDPPNLCDCCTTCFCFWPCFRGRCGDPPSCQHCCESCCLLPCYKGKCGRSKISPDDDLEDEIDDIKNSKVEVNIVDENETQPQVTTKEKNVVTPANSASVKPNLNGNKETSLLGEVKEVEKTVPDVK